jgi:hypothetical protein
VLLGLDAGSTVSVSLRCASAAVTLVVTAGNGMINLLAPH